MLNCHNRPLFCEQIDKDLLGALPLLEFVMRNQDQLLNEGLSLLATRFPDGSAHFAPARTPDGNPARAFEGECVPYLELLVAALTETCHLALPQQLAD